jgi:CHAT domain-containing protein
MDFDANPNALTSGNWSGYRVLHIAAHALVNEDQPELSGIALSMVDRGGASVNGVVRLHDVYRMRAPVELVTLSACRTSEGKNIAGEGVEGLARGFLVAGSRSVLAAKWEADDASTNQLMRSFYSAFLQENQTSTAALRAAQRKLIADKRFSAPYYWAGIVLAGSWQSR